MRGKEGKMNRAAEEEPKSGHKAPAKADAGPERKANMKGALMGSPEDHNPLRGAMKELESQHPQKYDDLGPHHGGHVHERHMPLHGMKPGR